jgi:Zn-dependent protease with chaperone function
MPNWGAISGKLSKGTNAVIDSPLTPVVLIVAFKFLMSWLVMFFSLISQSQDSKLWSYKLWLATGRKKRCDVRILDIKDIGPNAMAIFGSSTIFITKELVDMCSEREIIAICMHEMSHVMTHDNLLGLLAKYGSALSIILLFLKVADGEKFRRSSDVFKGIISILSIIAFCLIPTVLLNRTLGRWMENKSDSYSAKMGFGKDLISALKKINKWADQQNKNYRPNSVEKFLDKISNAIDEHPPLKERVENILKKEELYNAINKKNIKGVKDVIETQAIAA